MKRVRFAPSPTGTLHIGNALSAIANRAFGDWLLLRIDDTDPARNVAGGEEAIREDLAWLGVEWDEGPVRQSERASRYREAAARLGVTRFEGTTLIRDDGTATYQLATVIDDVDFGITHVIRGNDHRPNEPIHRRLHEALGTRPPEYVHHGLILGADGKKLSKRAEGATVASLRDAGIPAEAVRAYLEELGLPRHDVHLDLPRIRRLAIDAIEAPVKAGKVELPAGSMLIASSSRVADEVRKLGLQAVMLAAAPEVKKHALDLPRVAVFSTWGNTQDVGWTRYALDHFEVSYDLIYKERVRKGNLRAAYDVVLIPSQGGRGAGAKGLIFDVEGRPGKTFAYKKDSEFPSLGAYGESDDISGGMGLAGVAELDRFVNEGGVLITLGAASYFAPQTFITKTVDAAPASAAFYAPGPIVEAEILQPNHPIFYGYTDQNVPVRWAGGPLLRVPAEESRRSVLMRFPGTDQSVLSGLMRGVAETRMRPAIVDEPVGRGRVIIFSTNPAYRWQNLGEFNMLANALLNFNDMPKAAPVPAGNPVRN